MRLNVSHKLFLILLVVTGLVVFGMAMFMSWSFERGFVNYVEARKQERITDFVGRLEDYYTEHSNWHALKQDKAEWLRLIFSDEPHEKKNPPRWIEHLMKESMTAEDPEQEQPGKRPRLPIDKRVILLDANKQVIMGRPDDLDDFELHPVRHNSIIVGYAGILPGPPLERIVEARFLEKQIDNFIWIALAMVIFCAALAIPISRRLVKPLRAFNQGSQTLARGQYDTRIPVESDDELGQLARDFNALAAALERTEAQRRQWVADTSHELRTPISILRGEIEAMQDGMRPLDRQAIDSLHGEVMRLNRLVDDLYELARSDAGSLSYRPADVDPAAILEDVVEQYRDEFAAHDIELNYHRDSSTPASIHADPDRLAQLFRNILANMLRYTDGNGHARVSLRRGDNPACIEMHFEDSKPGVAADELEHLFQRFYRVESSRNRESGGAGLGLAICRNIVEAHGGQINADHSDLGGLHIRITLPLDN